VAWGEKLMKRSKLILCRTLLSAGVISLLLGGTASALAQMPQAEQASETLQAPAHPLDPLTKDEIRAAARALRTMDGFPAGGRFAILALDDPAKEQVLSFRPGASFSRDVFAVVLDRAGNKTYEAVVDVRRPSRPTVRSWKLIPGVQAMILDEEGEVLEEAVRSDAGWLQSLKKRGIDPDDVHIDFWAVGEVPPRFRGRRLLRALPYFRGAADNFYGQPIEGLEALVDMTEEKIVELHDLDNPPPVPPTAQDFDEDAIRKTLGALREPPKPLLIQQPQGPSFEIEGNQVSWQKWRLRYLVHPREGLVLYQVGYEDTPGKVRPILYRASFSEMAVPYGDPSRDWSWRCAFDVGEYGVGKSTGSIEPGLDAPDNAVLLDAVLATDEGRPVTRPGIVGIYERDGGLLWKHLETGGAEESNQSRRARELVVSSIATVGNYDYAINWIFRQDGAIEVEAALTGIMLAKGVVQETHTHDENGHLVSRRVVAAHHQHILNFRLDFDVDGTGNSVAEMNTRSLPPGPDNPAGTAMLMEEKVFAREQDARRDLSLADARNWRVLNPTRPNDLGHYRGYILVPGPNSVPYALPDSLARKRAGFMDHHVWVTRYQPRELYAGGDYPNQSEGGDGLPRYTAGNEAITNTDVVLWYTMTITHIPRQEEWPVMPTTRFGFRLIPGGFFERNPALDVPK
jgi:primary-amine oxidase